MTALTFSLFCFMVFACLAPWCLSLKLFSVNGFFVFLNTFKFLNVDSKSSQGEMPSNPTCALYQWKWWASGTNERNWC